MYYIDIYQTTTLFHDKQQLFYDTIIATKRSITHQLLQLCKLDVEILHLVAAIHTAEKLRKILVNRSIADIKYVIFLIVSAPLLILRGKYRHE